MKFVNYRKKQWGWTIMDTYLLRKFLGSVLYSIALLMTIIIVFDISQNVQYFNNASAGLIITGYYFNFIPYFVNLFFPLFTFISVIWFTGKLSERNEIISFLNGGISFYRFIVPYIVGAIILCFFSMFLANFIVPGANDRLNNFKEEYFYNRKAARLSDCVTEKDVHFKNDKDTYVYVRLWRKRTNNGSNFSYEVFGNDRITYKIRSNSIQYNEKTKKWSLYHYRIRSFDGDKESFITGYQLDTVFNFTPDDFNNDLSAASTMNYWELKNFIEKEQDKGSSLVKSYQIERERRTANPASIIVMTLLGLCVSARKTRRGIGVHIFVGMFFVFAFIFLQQVSTVFAVSESLSPAMAVWLPNLIYLVICIFFQFTIQK